MTNHRPISLLVLHDDVHGVVDNKSNERREARFARYAQGLCPRSWVVRGSSARGARAKILVYIYIYVYVCIHM